jgi:hypothetical protein
MNTPEKAEIRELTGSELEQVTGGASMTEYPRYVWHLDADVLYEARLTNSGNGEYHGYPLEDRWQWPKNFR